MTRALMTFMLFLGGTAAANDQHRLSYLEQEVRNLQRQVTALSGRLDDLTRPRPPGGHRPSEVVILPGGGAGGELPPWVDASRWRKVREGVNELDLLQLLGKPTSVRETDGARVLLYALELGPSEFLSGSVTIRDRAVTEVRVPTLQ